MRQTLAVFSRRGTLDAVSYAGDLTPQQAWELLESTPDAVLVDVRTVPEWQYVGAPDLGALGKQTVFVEWNHLDGSPNRQFLDELRQAGVGEDRPVLFLCRSGARSVGAANAATEAGFGPAYNILAGFEGPLDPSGHRGSAGWRADGLPWRQS